MKVHTNVAPKLLRKVPENLFGQADVLTISEFIRVVADINWTVIRPVRYVAKSEFVSKIKRLY